MCDNYADGDPRLEAWTAFRRGEWTSWERERCVECDEPIPMEDDVIEFEDGGRICERCADADH